MSNHSTRRKSRPGTQLIVIALALAAGGLHAGPAPQQAVGTAAPELRRAQPAPPVLNELRPPGQRIVIPPPRKLSILTINQNNAFPLPGLNWMQKVDRLTDHVVASGIVPDIISMTESSGWTSCTAPLADTTGDYDLVDRLISNLRQRTGVTYRVAYLVGVDGALGFLNRCRFFTGDTVLYNPNQLTNLTPADVAGRPLIGWNSRLNGPQVRRSLPLCGRASFLTALDTLIDGVPRVDRCNHATPSAPAWAQVETPPGQPQRVVASLARFGINGVAGSSFDVVTTHPPSTQEAVVRQGIDAFVAALTGPGYRASRPYYPAIVVGDYNVLAGESWPAGTLQVFRAPEDVMVVSLADNQGPLPALVPLRVARASKLPNEEPCRGQKPDEVLPGRSFSDHCGLLVEFSE